MDRLGRPCKPVWTDGSVGWDGRVGAANRLGRTAETAVVWTLLLKSKNELGLSWEIFFNCVYDSTWIFPL
ncbi:hypothetical protein BpHYR1_022930 [Brachionus plicatilis]|uniref:Uncharacterized protein n=1 Tax=Brachionus plicatilis TaxID=10195 RepID=A0A3M7PE08_BRAPC|nr:hypothetical protein BpHYR1_022930 [Brachionus plicatilis]